MCISVEVHFPANRCTVERQEKQVVISDLSQKLQEAGNEHKEVSA